MNVLNHLKNLSIEEIKEYYTNNSIDAAAGMAHFSGDFNLGNVIRSGNFFGFKEVFYIGGKRSYDRRSTVGTHNYIPTSFILAESDFLLKIKNKYSLVCVENNIPEFSTKTISIFENNVFKDLTNPPLFLFGEEQLGISQFLLNECERIITIPAFGTVRSLNVGSCASIIMAMYKKYRIDNLYIKDVLTHFISNHSSEELISMMENNIDKEK